MRVIIDRKALACLEEVPSGLIVRLDESLNALVIVMRDLKALTGEDA